MNQGRFATLSDEDLEKLLTDKSSIKTKQATKYAAGIFHEYCVVRKGFNNAYVVDTLPAETLDSLLESFYAEARNKKGEKYSVKTIQSIRGGLQRYYSEPPLRRSFDLIAGEAFKKSRAMFEAVAVDLKRSGLGNTEHKPVINTEDLQKLNMYFSSYESSPTILLHKVWFDIMLHFCRRGREGLRELTKDSYIIKEDGANNKYIEKKGSELSKNHRTDQETGTGGVIYGSENLLCPVKSFQLYLNKLNPNLPELFQRPLDNVACSEPTWYANRPLGKNTLGQMMQTISKAAALSKMYSNHSIRATSITALSDAGFESRQIQGVSKHRNVQSIESYSRDASLPQKRTMSNVLSTTLYKGADENEPNTKKAATCSSAVSSCTDLAAIPDTDLVPSPIMSSPRFQQVLAEVQSETNNFCYVPSMGRNLNISNVSGGVFNFYLNQ